MRKFALISLGLLLGIPMVALHIYAQSDPDSAVGVKTVKLTFAECLKLETEKEIMDCLIVSNRSGNVYPPPGRPPRSPPPEFNEEIRNLIAELEAEKKELKKQEPSRR